MYSDTLSSACFSFEAPVGDSLFSSPLDLFSPRLMKNWEPKGYRGTSPSVSNSKFGTNFSNETFTAEPRICSLAGHLNLIGLADRMVPQNNARSLSASHPNRWLTETEHDPPDFVRCHNRPPKKSFGRDHAECGNRIQVPSLCHSRNLRQQDRMAVLARKKVGAHFLPRRGFCVGV